MFANKEFYEKSELAEKMVETVIDKCQHDHTQREERWRGNIQLYHNVHDMRRIKSPKYPYESNLCLPTMLTHCEGVNTQVALSLLSNNPMVRAKPKRRDQVEGAKVTGWLMHDALNEDIDIRMKLPQWTRSSMQNLVWLKIGWTTSSRRVSPRTFNPQTGKYSADVETVQARGCPTWERCDLFNIWQDPWAIEGDVDNSRFIIERLIWTADQLEEFVDGAKHTYKRGEKQTRPWQTKNLDMILDAARKAGAKKDANSTRTSAAFPDVSSEERQKMLEALNRAGGYPGFDEDERLVQVWDWWEDEVHMMFCGDAGDLTCILREANPFEHGRKPLITLGFIRDEYGIISVCDVIADLATEKNTRRNQRMDEVKRCVNGLMFYNKNLVDGDLLASRPFGRVPVKAMPKDAIAEFKGSDVTQRAYEESDIIEREMQKATGFNDPVSGMSSGDTARGLQMRMQASNSRFELTVADYAGALRDAVKMTHANMRQFYTGTPQEEGVVPALDKEGQRYFLDYTFDQVNRDYAIEFTVDPTRANPAVHLQNMVNYLATIGANPEAASLIQWPEVHAEAFACMGYRDDAKRFVKGMDSIAQQEIDIFLAKFVFPPVTEEDDDQEHLESMEGLEQRVPVQGMDPGMIEQAMREIDGHRQDHMANIERKAAMAHNAQAALAAGDVQEPQGLGLDQAGPPGMPGQPGQPPLGMPGIGQPMTPAPVGAPAGAGNGLRPFGQ